jgi:hypothetical protein
MSKMKIKTGLFANKIPRRVRKDAGLEVYTWGGPVRSD